MEGRFIVNFRYNVIKHFHNEIVVSRSLSVFERDRTVSKVVIAEPTQIINFLYSVLKILIDNWFLGQWILLLQVYKDIIFEVLIKSFDDIACYIMSFI